MRELGKDPPPVNLEMTTATADTLSHTGVSGDGWRQSQGSYKVQNWFWDPISTIHSVKVWTRNKKSKLFKTATIKFSHGLSCECREKMFPVESVTRIQFSNKFQPEFRLPVCFSNLQVENLIQNGVRLVTVRSAS